MWLAAGYQRYLGFFGGFTPVGGAAIDAAGFASGVTPNSVYQVMSLRAAGQATKRIALQAEVQKALSGEDAAGQGSRSLIVQAHISYKLNGGLAFFVQADHYGQNINPFFDQAVSRNRYFGGIEMVLARPQQEDRGRYRHGKAPQDARPDAPVADATGVNP